MLTRFEIDADSISAEFKNGVLTVTLPKPAEAAKKTKKIKIKQARLCGSGYGPPFRR